MKLKHGVALWLCAPSLFLHSCAVGRNHTSDAALERVFNQHQAEFEALLADVQADSRLKTLQPRTLLYADGYALVRDGDFSEVERLGMPRERWVRYQKQLRDLGLAGGVLKGDGRVEFRADPGSLLNGDSYKGYQYTTTPPDHVRASLDGYRISDRDKDASGNWVVYKPLKPNWYLYLFVNR